MGNLVWLCRFHHRRVHDDGYLMTRLDDGTLEVLRPDGTPLTPSRQRRPSHQPDPTLTLIRERADQLATTARERRAA